MPNLVIQQASDEIISSNAKNTELHLNIFGPEAISVLFFSIIFLKLAQAFSIVCFEKSI